MPMDLIPYVIDYVVRPVAIWEAYNLLYAAASRRPVRTSLMTRFWLNRPDEEAPLKTEIELLQ